MNAILLYMNSVSKFIPGDVKRVLSSLSYQLNVMFSDNPHEFVAFTKTLANWVRVNIGVSVPLQGNIPDDKWNHRCNCPKILAEFFSELNRFDDRNVTQESLRILISILEIYNTVTTPKMPSIDTITDPSSANTSFIEGFDVSKTVAMLGIDSDQFRDTLSDYNQNIK
jgi:hypothetical protein